MSIPPVDQAPLLRRLVLPSSAVSQAILERCGSHLEPRTIRSLRFRLVLSTLVSAAMVLTLLGIAWTGHLSDHSLLWTVVLGLGWGLLQLGLLLTGMAKPPGKRIGRRWRRAAILGALGVALLQPLLVTSDVGFCAADASPMAARSALFCALESIALGGLVTTAMILIWRRTDPFSPGLSGATLGACGGLAGAVGTAFACPDHALAHLWVGHASTVILLTVLGAVAGRRWLSP